MTSSDAFEEGEQAGAAEAAALRELEAVISPLFARSEPQRQALLYLVGLLGAQARKNGWQLARYVGDDGPWRMQRLLNRAKWNADAGRDALRHYVLDHVASPSAALCLGETAVSRRGRSSAGVDRQYNPVTGRMETCQIGIFAAYAPASAALLVDRELYLPRSWADDPVRREQAKVPAGRTYAGKPALAVQMVQRARDAGMPFRYVTCDGAFGADPSLRRWLERAGVPYVVRVPGSLPVLADRQGPVVTAATALAARRDRQHRRPDDHGRGEPLWRAHRVLLPGDPHDHGAAEREHVLLVRCGTAAEPRATLYLGHSTGPADSDELVTAAMRAPLIDAALRIARDDVGLDRYEVRSWQGWYRHVTLAMLAAAFLAIHGGAGSIGGAQAPASPLSA
ncbi:MAG: IS701 family transposase [Frankiaceae bacterium]